MKIQLTVLTLAALPLLLASCTTAKKYRNTGGGSGLVNLLAVAEPISDAEIQSLKAIADSPTSMLVASSEQADTIPLTAQSGPTVAPSGSTKSKTQAAAWKRPGINPDEVNPGDIFGENDGAVLNKALSLADELPPADRRSLLNHYTSIKTSRVPMTLSRREINELRSLPDAETPLPTRAVTFDFRSESRSVAPGRLEELFARLGRGESAEAVESEEHQSRIKSQIASVRKRLKAGERLFVVTSVTESDGVTATYPGASISDADPRLITNALMTRYPHLNSIKAVQKDNSVIITGQPRILWGFETGEIVLKDDRLVIGSGSVAQL